MRKLIMFLSIVVMLSSCGEEAKNLLPFLKATIDGEEWVATGRVTVEQEGKFIITGTSITGEVLTITIFENIPGIHEFNILNPGSVCVFSESLSATDVVAAHEGFVDLKEVNTNKKNISGTFDFTAKKDLKTIKITGEFSRLNYTTTGM